MYREYLILFVCFPQKWGGGGISLLRICMTKNKPLITFISIFYSTFFFKRYAVDTTHEQINASRNL